MDGNDLNIMSKFFDSQETSATLPGEVEGRRVEWRGGGTGPPMVTPHPLLLLDYVGNEIRGRGKSCKNDSQAFGLNGCKDEAEVRKGLRMEVQGHSSR